MGGVLAALETCSALTGRGGIPGVHETLRLLLCTFSKG